MTEPQDGYNGPDKKVYFDTLARYEEAMFNVHRSSSLAGKALDEWERKGGDKADIRDGYKYRQLQPDEQKAELRRKLRVASWHGLVAEEPNGQSNFSSLFDAPPPVEVSGIGGAPIGSRLSVVRAMSAGFNDGKTKNGPSMGEGMEAYPWAPDSEEALAYAEGFGDGLKLRPPPKVRKEDKEAEESGTADGASEPPAAKKRGRLVGSGKKQTLNAEVAAELEKEVAAAEEQMTDVPESVQDIWDAPDFTTRAVN